MTTGSDSACQPLARLTRLAMQLAMVDVSAASAGTTLTGTAAGAPFLPLTWRRVNDPSAPVGSWLGSRCRQGVVQGNSLAGLCADMVSPVAGDGSAGMAGADNRWWGPR